MTLVDILIVFGVFAGFGILILSKLKTKNPQRYDSIMEWIKDTKKIKDSFSKPEVIHAPVLPDNARIM